MAIFNIPQFIDTEDKIAGPFTAKQLGWTIAAAAFVFVIYLFFGKTAAFIMAFPAVLTFGAFAFYKPNGQPLTFIAGSIVSFFLHPKLFIWRRLPEESTSQKKKVDLKQEEVLPKKTLTREKIGEIASLLNTPKNTNPQPRKTTHGNITFK